MKTQALRMAELHPATSGRERLAGSSVEGKLASPLRATGAGQPFPCIPDVET